MRLTIQADPRLRLLLPNDQSNDWEITNAEKTFRPPMKCYGMSQNSHEGEMLMLNRSAGRVWLDRFAGKDEPEMFRRIVLDHAAKSFLGALALGDVPQQTSRTPHRLLRQRCQYKAG